jgi:hypothetical protein
MKLFLFYCFLPFSLLSQEKSRSNKLQQELTIVPVSFSYYGSFFVGHALKYKCNFFKSFYTIAENDGVLFRKLDGRNRNFSSQFNFLKLNQFKCLIGNSKQFGNLRLEKFKKRSIGWQLGYHYFQQATRSGDYWLLDSVAGGGVTTLSGIKTHSLIAGLDYHQAKKHIKHGDTVEKHSHNLNFACLINLKTNVSGFNQYATYSEPIQLTNNFISKQLGMRLEYLFEKRINQHVSMQYGSYVMWYPCLNYKPNYKLYVPKGGEVLVPLIINLKVGCLIH